MSKLSRSGTTSGRSRAPAGLSYKQVLTAALEVLDEVGLVGLSLRRVADRLDVHVNTVAWHVKDKASLLKAMGDDLMRSCTREPLPEDPHERTRALVGRFRQGLLSRRDGGRLSVEGYDPAGPNHLAFGEALTGALLETGRELRDAVWASWTLMYFASGLVQEQQSAPQRMPGFRADAVDASSYPILASTVPYLGADTFDARFEHGLDLILGGSASDSASR